MAVIPGHHHPNGALYLHHCLSCEFTLSPPEQQTWPLNMLGMDGYILCVAISWDNKINFSFGVNVAGFGSDSQIYKIIYTETKCHILKPKATILLPLA